ncbi:hypothetical protein Nepgr_020518 [Nepenthes gracilis]|uniref:TFIIS N-terminal domain-containing protein n=1 Tax=Nepenthes gracilis TaxID=150966 RepID=A0AAD3SY71_NEPGR|nr:hypothetical protein Nepgr_020518 [Nepenthes gracilis]
MSSGNLDRWRNYFRSSNSSIFDVIKNGIRVAATDCPELFTLRRDQIAEKLFTCGSPSQFSNHTGVQSPMTQKRNASEPNGDLAIFFSNGILNGTCGHVEVGSNEDQNVMSNHTYRIYRNDTIVSNHSYEEACMLTDDLEEDYQIVKESQIGHCSRYEEAWGIVNNVEEECRFIGETQIGYLGCEEPQMSNKGVKKDDQIVKENCRGDSIHKDPSALNTDVLCEAKQFVEENHMGNSSHEEAVSLAAKVDRANFRGNHIVNHGCEAAQALRDDIEEGEIVEDKLIGNYTGQESRPSTNDGEEQSENSKENLIVNHRNKECWALVDDADEEIRNVKEDHIVNYSFGEVCLWTNSVEERNEIVSEVLKIKKVLNNSEYQCDLVLTELLKKLKTMELTVEILKVQTASHVALLIVIGVVATLVGQAVTPLTKHESREIRQLARGLVRHWRALVDAWVEAQEAIPAEGSLHDLDYVLLEDEDLPFITFNGDPPMTTDRLQIFEDVNNKGKIIFHFLPNCSDWSDHVTGMEQLRFESKTSNDDADPKLERGAMSVSEGYQQVIRAKSEQIIDPQDKEHGDERMHDQRDCCHHL